MRKICLAILALVVALGLVQSTQARQAPVNLIRNPGFEGEYSSWNYVNEAQVAPEWTPWWRNRTEADPPATFFRPEYKKADGYIYPNRVRSGAAAQQWFTFYSSHQAGMYQQVFNVTPGVRYRFTIWAQVWSSVKDNPDYSTEPAYPNLQVGIDPTGYWDPWQSTVVWSGTYAFYDTWGQLSVEAVAQKDTITVFMRSQPEFTVKHNDMYWDDAELVAVGTGALPAATPTRKPAGTPTQMPAGTPAPSPTLGTPKPTATCAPPPADWATYKVQAGDTLSKLAAKLGTTLNAIISANCLRTTTIYVDQALLLPAIATPTSLPVAITATATLTATATIQPSATPMPSATPTPTPSPIPLTVIAMPTMAPFTVTPATATPMAITIPLTPQTGLVLCGGAALAAIVLLALVFWFRRRSSR